MNRRAIAVAALGVFFILLKPHDVFAWCQYCSESTVTPCDGSSCCAQPCVCEERGGLLVEWPSPSIRWSYTDSSTPSNLTVDEVRGAIRAAFGAWSAVSCDWGNFETTEIREPSTVTAPEFNNGGENVNAVAFLERWSASGYDSRAVAITSVVYRVSSGITVDSDIVMNTQNWTFSLCEGGQCNGSSNLTNTLAHEAGHFLGLEHTELDDDSVTMWMCEVGDATRAPLLSADDMTGLCEVYAESPAPTDEGGCGCSASPAPAQNVLWLLLAGFVLSLRRRF